MTARPVNPPALQDHDALRKKFEEKADSILNGLESKSQVSYDCDALRELGVLLQHINVTDDQQSFDFKPLSEEEYSTYKIDSSHSTGIPKHIRPHYDDFDALFHWRSSWPLSDTALTYEKAFQIARYISILKDYSEKDDADNTFSIEQNSNWHQIMAEDSFNDGPQGMLCGLRIGHSKPLDLPKWRALSWRQWQEDPESPDTIRPHVMLMTCTGAVAESDNLLHGEIGPIVNAIQCRLFQDEFKQTSTFPVLVISLFGPRQGRILSARFNIDGTLVVRASDIFDFKEKNQEGFDLFMRYYYSEPQDAAEFKLLLLLKTWTSPLSTDIQGYNDTYCFAMQRELHCALGCALGMANGN
ncbi:uncharacterized protein N7515_006637 [Penicillium bovifimosum]|uniref:Uncharacterized protein n=1 Tax=Penicillium bovifimosum TaxID=126998 RepID=A0A9W9GVE1_9EURO|nr:uncharacterized protein N7515_006637 [Penicillium bovifimosum]KAJ5130598.1 hypothetical protein N7515_006637 [Penicillium bovifimosum]